MTLNGTARYNGCKTTNGRSRTEAGHRGGVLARVAGNDDGGVIYDLADEQWAAIESGCLTAPDGTVYQRRTTRIRRGDADTLIASGAPLICYWYSGGQLDWHDGNDARAVWARLRSRVTPQTPRPDPGGDPAWTAGNWDSNNGHTILVLTGHC